MTSINNDNNNQVYSSQLDSALIFRWSITSGKNFFEFRQGTHFDGVFNDHEGIVAVASFL